MFAMIGSSLHQASCFTRPIVPQASLVPWPEETISFTTVDLDPASMYKPLRYTSTVHSLSRYYKHGHCYTEAF